MKRLAPSDLPELADILVIGGGITGASIARDAALRGLSVVLVEKNDFSSGTSSRSSKLIHGGLRYLQTYQFRMVRESVREREVMMRIAPHLASLQPFLYLLYQGDPESRFKLNFGLTFYDLFSGAPLHRRHHMLDPKATLAREPALNSKGLKGAGLYQDASTDDARLVLDVLKSGHDKGALLANYQQVCGMVENQGRVVGAEIEDQMTGDQFIVRAKTIVNAAGPWVDRINNLVQADATPQLRPTKGTHIVLRKEEFPLNTAIFLRSPDDNRVVWAIPARDDEYVFIGTTDSDYGGSLDEVVASEQDFDYLLAVANHALPDARVDRSQIVASWAGLRPLLAPKPGESNPDIPRTHHISVSDKGVVTVAGGKLTTARKIAEEAVDHVVQQVWQDRINVVPKSSSATVPISGGDTTELTSAKQRLAATAVSERVQKHWLGRYGSNAHVLAGYAESNIENGQQLGTSKLTPAEINYAINNEMAMTVSDVLIRRTGAFYWSADGGTALMNTISDELEAVYGSDLAKRTRQQAEYSHWVQRNRPRETGH